MQDVISAIEHTALKAEVTPRDVERLCAEAREYGFAGVCVNPGYVAHASRELQGTRVLVVTVVGFPLGAGTEASDASECERVLAQGAQEIDWVIPVGLALSGDLEEVVRRAHVVRRATLGVPLKVIFECGHFSSEALRVLAARVMEAEPDYLKTATGFGPGGATRENVALLSEVAKPKAQVKASGGVRDILTARQMLEAGATRIGTSSGVAIAQALR